MNKNEIKASKLKINNDDDNKNYQEAKLLLLNKIELLKSKVP